MTCTQQIHTLYPKLMRLALRILKDEEDAKDAVQSAWAQVFAHKGEFRGEAAFATWIYRITYNEALMLIRRRVKYYGPLVEEDGEHVAAPFPDPDAKLYLEAVAEKIDDKRILNQYQRQLLLARVAAGESKEVAEETGQTLLSVKAVLHRARTKLRYHLGE